MNNIREVLRHITPIEKREPFEDGVRTSKARRLIRNHLKKAKKFGHTPSLICRSGYMELYGCLNQECGDTLDCWDSPEICNGPLSRRQCVNPATSSRLKNIFKFYSYLLRWFQRRFR